MAEVTAENILAAAAVELSAMDTDDVTDAAAPDAEAVESAAESVVDAAVAAPSAASGAAAAAEPAADASAVPAAAATATATVVPPRPFNMKWLQQAEKNRQHFADELFNTVFTQENVEKVVQNLKTLTANKIANSYRLCEDDHTYSVQIATHGFVRTPTHLMRIELPYTVLADDSAVCIFVRDLKKPPTTPGRNAKAPNLADLTVKHYEQLLTAAKVDISTVTIMPLSQLFNEHSSLDQRRKLTYLYDKFMVEAPVATRVNGFLGAKMLYDSRAAFPIDLQASDLAGEFDVVLRQVFYQSHQSVENQFVRPQICVGRESQDVAQVAENIIDLLGQLGPLQPGGAPNISTLYLRASGNVATAVDLYRDPATSAPEIPAPELPEPVVVKNDDGTETVVPPAEKLTVNLGNVNQHIIDNQHFIVYDGEDDYSEEFGVHDAPAKNFDKRLRGGVNVGGDAQRQRGVVGQQPHQQQHQQQRQQQQQTNVARAGPSGVKKIVGTVASGNTADVDQLVMRGLKKLLAQQNLAGLMAGQHNGGGGNVPLHQQQQQQQQRRMQPQQNGGGTSYVVRRPINQQRVNVNPGIVGRNQMGGGNVQRRVRYVNNNGMMNGNNMGGNGGGMRQNRRFI